MPGNFTHDGSGLFAVRYEVNDDLLPERQEPLVSALRESVLQRKTGIVVVLSPDIAGVDSSVPAFWLKVTATLTLAGMAIVTPSAGVRVAASGFRLANVVRGVKLPVETFDDEAAGRAWLEGHLR